MASRLARAYVIATAVVATFVLILFVVLHIRALLGHGLSMLHLFALGMITSMPLLGLAKDRNIWVNEMRVLPDWVRSTMIALFVYYFFVFSLILIASDIRSTFGSSVLFSSFFIAFLPGPLCVPFALLRPSYLSSSEFSKRVLKSLGFLALGILIAILAHFDLLPKHQNIHSITYAVPQDFHV